MAKTVKRVSKTANGAAAARADWAKVREIARRRLKQMERLERSVRHGKRGEAVHDFRVASRRAEAAFDLLISPQAPGRIRRLRKRLARGRKSISTARNYEVICDRAKQALANGEEGREAWSAIRDYFNKERRRKRTQAIERLRDLNSKQTYTGLRTLLDSSANENHHSRRPALASRPLKRVAAAQLQKRWRRFEKAAASSNPSAVHELRLAVKRLRYLVEILLQFDAALSPQTLQVLRKLQQRLGEWHDREVEHRLLLSMLGRPKFLHQQLPLAQSIFAIASRDRVFKERDATRDLRRSTGAALNRLRVYVQPVLKDPVSRV